MKLQNQRKFIVYSFHQTGAMDFIDSKEHVLLVDSTSGANNIKLNVLRQYWKSLELSDSVPTTGYVKNNTLYIKDEFIQFYNKRIVILKDPEKTKKLNSIQKSLEVDYVILSQNVNVSIQQIIVAYHPKCIVFDASNKAYRVKQWESFCKANRQKYYSVMDRGAMIVEF